MAGSRSWTDATTNNVVFRGLDAPAYFRWLSKRDQDDSLGDSHLLGSFLHEFAHHWCNRTLLGATLALFELRLAVFAPSLPDGRTVWSRDYLAHQSIMSLLRPVSEGLAQMAEFDLTHIDRNARTGTPLAAATLCFGLGADDVFRHSMLQRLRHSDDLLRRKASLYLKKFDVEEGYLPGYMSVKNYAWTLIGRGYNVPIEYLLTYIRSYFWDDPVFVNILVSENMNGAEVSKQLFDRFRNRMHNLFAAPDLPERVKAFWEKWHWDSPRPPAFEIYCTDDELTLAFNRIGLLEHHYRSLLHDKSGAVESAMCMTADAVERLLDNIDDNRRYVTLASVHIRVSVDGNFSLIDGDGQEHPSPELSAFGSLAPNCYELVAVVSTFGSFLGILAVDQNGEVFALTEIQAADSDDGIRESTIRYVKNRRALQDTFDKLRRQFDDVGMNIIRSKVLDTISAKIRQTAGNIYEIAATARVQVDRLSDARTTLRTQALMPLFAKDTVAVRLVAGISMLAGTDQVLEHLTMALVNFAQFYYLQDFEVADLRKRLDDVISRDRDALLLREVDGTLFCFL
jgi:hypothetical protein